MRRLPDPELIAFARKGSADAAGVLFDRYWAHAWSAAFAVTADRVLADDAAQEAIQKAFGSLDRFGEARPFGPPLRREPKNGLHMPRYSSRERRGWFTAPDCVPDTS